MISLRHLGVLIFCLLIVDISVIYSKNDRIVNAFGYENKLFHLENGDLQFEDPRSLCFLEKCSTNHSSMSVLLGTLLVQQSLADRHFFGFCCPILLYSAVSNRYVITRPLPKMAQITPFSLCSSRLNSNEPSKLHCPSLSKIRISMDLPFYF